MNSFKGIVESIISFWKDANPVSRFGFVFLIVFCCAAIGLVGYWSSVPSYVTLVSDGDLDKISRVVDELEKNNIQYELAGAGGVLRVDQRSLPRARMLAENVGLTTDQGDASNSMGTMWMDPTERKNLEVRNKERMLEATISSYAVVDKADVHLNVPINGPFERRVATPTASVLVAIRPGQRLTGENVLAIASTVAFAIEELDPAAIRITDESGKVYQVPDSSSGRVDNQMEYTNQQERSLAFKAQQQLARFFGMGNSSVQISLDYTFIESNQKTTEYDSDGKVAKSEDILTKSIIGDEVVAQGPVGVEPNLATGNGGRGAKQEVRNKEETLKNEYLVPETVINETNHTPKKNYMTVSVLVNSEAPGVLAEDGSLPADIKTRVEQLVKTAVGFQEDTDGITVDFAAFPVLEDDAAVEAPFDWVWLNEILRNASLAIAALVVLVLGLLTLRVFKSRGGSSVAVAANNAGSDRLEQISELARKNPEVFASVVKAWAGNQNPSDVSLETSDKAA